MNYLTGVNEGLVVYDLQGASDPRVPVRVASGWTSEVKDHQSLMLSGQIQELFQCWYSLVLDLKPLI